MSTVLSTARRITGGVVAVGAVATAAVTAHLAGGAGQTTSTVATSEPAQATTDSGATSADPNASQQSASGSDPATGWGQGGAAAAGTHGS